MQVREGKLEQKRSTRTIEVMKHSFPIDEAKYQEAMLSLLRGKVSSSGEHIVVCTGSDCAQGDVLEEAQ